MVHFSRPLVNPTIRSINSRLPSPSI